MFKLIIFALLLNSLKSQLPEYNQCAGDNWGPVECKQGLKCHKKDQWYWQCLKSCPKDWECHNSIIECTKPSCQTIVLEYGQCGGVAHKGATKCATGLFCFKNNKWYSQCLKKCPCGWECCEKSTFFTTTTIKSTTTSLTTQFPNCLFRYGTNFISTDNKDYSNYDYLTLTLGQINSKCVRSNSKNVTCTDFERYDGRVEVQMLNTVRMFKKTAVLKSFIIGNEALNLMGLEECELIPYSLCVYGASFIRENSDFILQKYENLTSSLKPYLSKIDSIFIIEPSFWQYYGSRQQIGGTLTGDEMRKLFNDIISIIKQNIPNAMIAWDASLWLSQTEMTDWWAYFKDSELIDFVYASSQDMPYELSFKFLNSLTGKKLIVESDKTDYLGPQDKWYDDNYVKDRIKEGVISYSFINPVKNPGYKAKLC